MEELALCVAHRLEAGGADEGGQACSQDSMDTQRSTDFGEFPQSSQSVRWHPALLRQDEQSSHHSITRSGANAWPGRIVGVHRIQPPATTGPFADVWREFSESTRESQSAWVSTAAPVSANMHAHKEPQRCLSAPVESTEEPSRLQTHHAASCSRTGEVSAHVLLFSFLQ